MSMQRTRTPRELTRLAGRLPAVVLAAAIMGALLPAAATAQDGRPPLRMDGGNKGGDPQVRVTEHDTVDLHVKDEDLANVLELLSIQTERNIVISKNVSAKVTASLYNVTFYDALDAILHVNGFGYLEKGDFIFVHTIEELEEIGRSLQQRVAKRIGLNYLTAEDAKLFVEPLLSDEGGEILSSTAAEEFEIDDDVPTGGEDYAMSSMLVVYDYEENIEQIERLIDEIDTRPEQVLVQATILQTSLSEANGFGVDFSFVADFDIIDFADPLGVVDGLINGSPGDDRNVNYGGQSNAGNVEAGAATFKVGVTGESFSVFVRLLDEITDTTILANPKVLCLNRQPSRVLVGRRVGYLSSTTTDTATTQSIEYLDTGTQLYFRPFVSDNKEIRVELKPQVSEAIIRETTDALGGTITIPDEVTQEIVTNVIVRDEQTIVLGGLFREATSYTRRQVPILGDLPIVGSAFRGHDDSTDRSEIIFMITPSIVTDSLLASSSERATNDVERVRAGTRKGVLPWSRELMTAKLNMEAEELAANGDYDAALNRISRSLSLNPKQAEVFRLRERITSEAELWPDRSLLNFEFEKEDLDSMREIEPAEGVQVSAETRAKEGQALHNNPMFRDTQMSGRMKAFGAGGEAETIDLINNEEIQSNNDMYRSPVERNMRPNAPTQSDDLFSSLIEAAEAETNEQFVTINADGTLTIEVNNGDLQQLLDQLSSKTGFSINTTGVNNKKVTAFLYSVDLETALAETLHTGGFAFFAANGQYFVHPDAKPQDQQPANADETAPMNNVELSAKDLENIEEANETAEFVREQIEQYAQINGGDFPLLDEFVEWSDLIAAGLLKDEPVNPWIGGDNGALIVVGTEADQMFHDEYGWIYNPETGELWAAGFDADGEPLSRNVVPSAPLVEGDQTGGRESANSEDVWPEDLFSRFVPADDVFNKMTEDQEEESDSSVVGVEDDQN